MPKTQVRSYRVNVDSLMRILGAIGSIGAMAVGIVSFVKYPPGGVGLTVKATLDNINAGFATMVLTALTIFVGILLLLVVIRIAPLKTLHFFMVGYVSIGLAFIMLGFMCFGIA